MNRYTYNPGALRVAKARLGRRGARTVANALLVISGLGFLATAALIVTGRHQGLSLGGLALLALAVATWLRRDVLTLPAAPLGSTTELSALLPADLLPGYRTDLTPAQLWPVLAASRSAQFMLLRCGLRPDDVAAALATAPALDHDQLWDEAAARAQAAGSSSLSGAAALAALGHLVPALQHLLTLLKLEPADLDQAAEWAVRLEALQHAPRPVYGGVARDWAAGFTPQLSHFGHNLSRQIELSTRAISLYERTEQLDALVTALGSGNGSVALVGENGIGKSALLLGLADRLLQGQAAGPLAHHQVVALDASLLLSQQTPGRNLESLVLELFGEAAHAGNIILALDEAQLFFGQGTGAVNLSQVLLPIMQSRHLRLVLAFTPGDWQKLRGTAPALTNLLTPIVLTEPSPADTRRILTGRVVLLEQGRLTTTYQAISEAMRQSARYYQDQAEPGRSLKLLEAAMSSPEGPFVTPASIQRVIEQQFGVKLGQASGAESDVLLNLENRIHERMINQTRAVSVVAAALRRARAGVASPNRPVGSFLFLGPTGVGKTELARSLAAVYYGAESTMIRLDMSEYQRPEDVTRLLSTATDNPTGLLPKIRTAPSSVVLFDEIEKAHPNLLNLFLQLLDEGRLTDAADKPASFKDAIIIATSNAGADDIRKHIEAGEQLEAFEQAFTDQLISSGQFKPELLNRFDEIVLFRPLNQAELAQVVGLMLHEVNHTLEPQKIQVVLTDAAIAQLVATGYDPRLGARPMRRVIQRQVEDAVAGRILRHQAGAGDTITLDVADLQPATPQ